MMKVQPSVRVYRQENVMYVGTLPDKKYYDPDGMSSNRNASKKASKMLIQQTKNKNKPQQQQEAVVQV